MELVGAVLQARLGVEALDDLEVVRDLVRGEAHLPPDLRVLVALELLHVVAHHDVGGRALQAQVLELQAQALVRSRAATPAGSRPCTMRSAFSTSSIG